MGIHFPGDRQGVFGTIWQACPFNALYRFECQGHMMKGSLAASFCSRLAIWRIRVAFERIIAYGDPAKKSRVLAARKKSPLTVEKSSSHWGKISLFYQSIYTYIYSPLNTHAYIYALTSWLLIIILFLHFLPFLSFCVKLSKIKIAAGL